MELAGETPAVFAASARKVVGQQKAAKSAKVA